MLPPQGGLPASLSHAPVNAGPATMPQGNQGNTALALIDVKNALQLLQKALPMIPMGSEAHGDVLDAMKKVSKHLPQDDDSQGLQLQSLLQMAQRNAKSTPMHMIHQMAAQGAENQPPAVMQQGSPAAPQPPQQ